MALSDFPALLDRLEQNALAPEDRALLEELVEAAPGHVTAHVVLARACEQAGQPQEARRHWQHAHLLAPASPTVRAGHRRTRPAPDPEDEAAEDEVPFVWRPSRPGDAPAEEASGEEMLAELSSAEGALAGRDDDLDALIEELEGARIDPTPDPDDVPAPDLDAGDGDVVSPTLARIYEAQGQHAEAARVYRRLAEERPAQADAYRQQADALDAEARRANERGEGDAPAA